MFLHALIFFLQAEFSAYWQHNKNFKQRCGKIAKYKLCLLNGEGIYQSETDVDGQTIHRLSTNLSELIHKVKPFFSLLSAMLYFLKL